MFALFYQLEPKALGDIAIRTLGVGRYRRYFNRLVRPASIRRQSLHGRFPGHLLSSTPRETSFREAAVIDWPHALVANLSLFSPHFSVRLFSRKARWRTFASDTFRSALQRGKKRAPTYSCRAPDFASFSAYREFQRR